MSASHARGQTARRLLALFVTSFVLGACTKKAPEVQEETPAVEQKLDLWAGVPDLDPTAEQLLGELVPKPGPQKPKQVGEEIELPFPPPDAATPPVGETETITGALEVLRRGPDGEQALVEAIRVSFNHPMVPLASIEDLRAQAVPMQIEPAVEGEFRWMGTRTLAFYPSGRLPFSTTYEVTIPAGSKSTHGTELAKDERWTISTPTLAIDRAMPYDEATHVKLESPLVLRFNQPVDAEKLIGALSLKGGGKSFQLETIPEARWQDEGLREFISGWVTGSEQDWERRRVIVVKPSAKLSPDTRYTLSLPAGVYGEGPERSKAIALDFQTYPPLKLWPSSCDPSPCSASYGISLEASNQIRDARVDQKVHVSPEVEDLDIDASWNGISLSGKFVGETTYTVTVDAGLEDVYGQQLGKTYTAKIKLGPLEPNVMVWPQSKNPGIIEAKAGHTIQVKVTGLRELELMASSFNSAELAEYYRYNGGIGYDYAWPDSLPRPRHQQKLNVADSRKREQILTIDLDEYVERGDTFVYLMGRSEVFMRWGWEERSVFGQIVQLTNLGVSAVLDRDDGAIMVTTLDAGTPVAGAEVQLRESNSNTATWTGKTDADGIARPSYAARRIYDPLILVKQGSDEAFLPLNQGDVLNRWLGWLIGQPAEAQNRAFIFTERAPYKPGETVHLVGVVRRETRGPKGGVEPWGGGLEFEYTVTTPRGVEVQKGKTKLSEFGTFTVDIETDENGDTGNYTFSMSHSGLFGGYTSFSHSFAVEAFRTPEFEVEVERPESKPLYFGDELEVEIRGRYLFGAPMIGADVSYTLSRQGTDFRPPADGLSGFHFSATPGHRWFGWGYGGGEYWGGGFSPSIQLEAKSKQLDEDGILKVTHALAQVEPAKPDAPKPTPEAEPKPVLPQAATFTVAATVTDENRQAIAGNGSFVVHPSAYYAGLRSERSVLREGEQTRVEAVVVDVEGKRVEGVDIELRAIRKHTTRKPVQKDGVWVYEYATEEQETGKCALVSGSSPVACDVSVGEAGTHEVVAKLKDAQGRANQAAIEIFVHGDDAVIWDENNKRVDLVLDKDSYEIGDKAKILVRSPFDQASGFLVVEREGIAEHRPLKVGGGAAVVELDISKDMVAGVTVSAVLTKPRTTIAGAPADQDLGAPAAASGTIPLEVSKKQKTVVVDVTPSADRIEPGDKLTIEVATHSVDGEAIPAAVTLFVVDEGVLSLMGFQTPDPLSFFHYQRAGEVGLYADHPLVLPRNVEQQPKPQEQQQPLTGNGDVFGGLIEPTATADAFDGLGMQGTGQGGGGTGEGTIGLGAIGLIGRGGGGGTGSGYGAGPGGMDKDSSEERKEAPMPEAAAAPAPAKKGRSPAQPVTATSTMSIDANKAMNQEISLRTLFATTAHFESEVRTDAAGKASVEITMPENLTSFRIMAVAVDPEVRDRFGSGEASVRVRKSIMLRPSLPRFLNLGDSFEASVMVDNQSEEQQAVMVGTRGLNVKMSGELESVLEIPAGESREVRFPMAVDQVGTMRLQFAALANNGRDATQIDVPVLVPATKQAFADYGMTSDSVLRQVLVPKDALAGFGGLEVSMSSTALNGLEDAVEYLVSYPYECSEQTASRLLPIFALGDILDDFPIADVHDRARRDALARAGIERLFERQHWDGGFTYWGEVDRYPSWPYITTWVTLALLEGKAAGYEVNQEKLDRALVYLENYVRNGVSTRWGPYYDWTSRAFALWLLSREGRASDAFDKVWDKRKQLPLYARVLLMSAAHRYKRQSAVDEVLAELRDLVVENARVIHFAESRSEAGAEDGLSVLMHSNTQTDAIVLIALMEVGLETGDDGMAPKIMAGLMDDRDPRIGGRWTSTHANAWALMAASRYYKVMESETPDYTAQIWLDDLYAGEHKFAGRDMSKINQHIPMAKLMQQSVGSVTLAKDGPGKLYYRLGLRYAPADFRMDPVDRGFTVSRRYEALPEPGEDKPDPEAVKRLDDGTWQVKAGTNVKVTLTLVSDDRASFVVVDDPLPAGFEGQNPRFLTSVGVTDSGTRDYGYELGGRYGRGGYDYNYGYNNWGWWWPWWEFDHKQMRDDRMLLFADWLPAGVYTYSYTARATNIGTFVLPPVHAEAMYQPERFGHGSSSVVKIVE